ncbi:hypothetical protein ACQ86G_14270 [Roseateles chitinivorans]|uniref:hypothetical protein n=1 Tax=Roseateles chitinivorans TaxID=2917965 RepID=UPI003D67214F
MPFCASRAAAVGDNVESRVGVAMREVWLPLLAAMPWLLMAVAGLLWALTLQRGVPHAHALLIAQPMLVAGVLVLAALAAGALNILAGTLSLLWKPTTAGGVTLASGVLVVVVVVVVVVARGLW